MQKGRTHPQSTGIFQPLLWMNTPLGRAFYVAHGVAFIHLMSIGRLD